MPLPSLTLAIRKILATFNLTGGPAADQLGFPRIHAATFCRTAHDQSSVIISREVGLVCRDLIMEGYDSKGSRIKTKTCNWGPMAGFVCVDPRFTKKGIKAEDVSKMYHESYLALTNIDLAGVDKDWKASTTPIKISESRIQSLGDLVSLKAHLIALISGPYQVWKVTDYTAPDKSLKSNFQFALVQEKDNKELFGVCIDREFSKWEQYTMRQKREYADHIAGVADNRFERVLGLTNPHKPYREGDYRNAVTGDYDLFAVWPYKGAPNPLGWADLDARFSHPLAHNAKQREHPQLGNISDRVQYIGALLNSQFRGDKKRQMVHHSDEVGNPGEQILRDKLPLLAFVPFREGTVVICIKDAVRDWRNFLELCDTAGFAYTLHPSWPQ